MPRLGVPNEKIQEIERHAIQIAEAKNYHLSEWRIGLRALLDENHIDEELFASWSDSVDYVTAALLLAQEQNALIKRHAQAIYGGVDDNNSGNNEGE